MRYSFFLKLASLFFLLLAWHLLALVLNKPALPPPGKAFLVFGQQLREGLGRHFLVSSWRILASILLSLLIGVPLGIALGAEKKLDLFFAPLVYLTYPLPKIAFLPVVMYIFGLGDAAKIFLIALVVFFQILVTVRDAVRNVSQAVIVSVVSLGAGRLDVYRHVIWPAVVPEIFTALRIGSGTAIAVLFFAESFASSDGLGYYLMDAWSRYMYGEMFAGIIALGCLGYFLYVFLDFLDRKLCAWKRM
ncbi:MAG: ABC transporter permease [Desulfotomaculales bacterium]